jgi:hypothetical protein
MQHDHDDLGKMYSSAYAYVVPGTCRHLTVTVSTDQSYTKHKEIDMTNVRYTLFNKCT